MILTLDEVRQIRFHMARRSGYEVTDVDNFVDAVEATLAAMTEENETLKQQVAMGERQSGTPVAESDAKLLAENERLRSELQGARDQLTRAAHGADVSEVLKNDLAAAQRENEELRRQVAELQSNHSAPGLAASVGNVRDAQKIIVETSEQASPAVVRLVELSTQQAEQVVNEAEAEAKRTIDEANKRAHEITVDAKTRAERIESEARINADKVTAEAQAKADNLKNEAAQRRTELFAQLEAERDELKSKVAHLREFESTYRSNITSHLQGQIDQLNKGVFEPGEKPHLLDGSETAVQPKRDSATPRLDALLGDGR